MKMIILAIIIFILEAKLGVLNAIKMQLFQKSLNNCHNINVSSIATVQHVIINALQNMSRK